MDTKDIVDKAGGVYAVAEAFGITRQAVEQWIKTNRVPAHQALAVADMAGLPPSQIRPDIYPAKLFAA